MKWLGAMMVNGHVILLDGSIGVGKTTLGRLLATRFDGTFLDGDEFGTPGKPWFASSLSTCRQIRDASLDALARTWIVFVARPVRCWEWVFFTRHFERRGIGCALVGLQAMPEAINAPSRGRRFSERELARILEMIAQGYGARSYSDAVVRTDQADLDATVERVSASLRAIGISESNLTGHPGLTMGQENSDRRRQLRRFMDAACRRLGFCLPEDARERLMNGPRLNPRDFLEALIKAEGIDPIYLERYELYKPLLEIYRRFLPED
ncbi:MAG: hypothetical protein AAGH68_07635 [Pseudomonadota bacterium]